MASKINTPKFYSFSNLPKTKKLEVGSKIYKKYGAVIDKETNKVVVKVIDSFDITENIQSYRKEADIYYLLEKFKNGQALPQTGANTLFYGDVSEIPTNMLDMSNLLQKGEGMFNSLSEETKKKYGLSNVKDFIDAMFSGKFNEIKEEKVEVQPEKKEVVSNDTNDKDK